MNVPEAIVEIIYNGKNISSAIGDSLIDFTYTDNASGESDEISLQLENRDRRWLNNWRPRKGDTIVARIRFKGKTLPCGTFEVDEPRFSGPPDVLTLKALATGITKAVRTKNSRSYEKNTLRAIAEKVASNNGFTVAGDIPDITIENTRQYRTTDVAFLHNLASKYGCIFSLRDKQMTFTEVTKLEARVASTSLDLTDLISYDIVDKTVGVVAAANVTYHNPVDNKLTGFLAPRMANGQVFNEDNQNDYPDTLEIRVKAENTQQAEAMAKAAVYAANTNQIELQISTPGNVLLVAGNNIGITGLGYVSGKYTTKQSRHKVSRGGAYTVDADLRLITPGGAARPVTPDVSQAAPSGPGANRFVNLQENTLA